MSFYLNGGNDLATVLISAIFIGLLSNNSFRVAKIQYFFKIECENNVKKLYIGIKVRIIHYLCRKK